MYELLLALCKENEISITNLCLEITGSRGNLSTWKKGNINPTVLSKIADYFGVSTDYLLGRTNDPNGYGSNQIQTGDIKGKRDVSMSINSKKSKFNEDKSNKFDNTTTQVAEVFQDLNVFDKAKVLNLIAELSEKKGV